MKIIVADAETFWSPTHSLSKMNPVAYVMHPETELISMAVKEGNTPTKVIFGEDAIQAWADSVDWSDVMLVGHNMSGFDSMIFAWRLGVNPKMWACTLAMAKPLHGITVGGSLGKLVEHYGLGVKDQTVLHNTKGRHLKDFTPEEVRQMAIYNAADTDQTCALFFKLLPQTSKDEMRLIDMTVRMLVEPQFDVNTELLEKTLLEERERKLESLLRVAESIGAVQPGMTEAEIAEAAKKTLASQPKFAAFLESRGVEVPMKQSPSNPDKQTYALAKTDEGFIALQEHEDPLVAAAAIARLGVKSTILETRIQTFLEMAENCDGYMPIALIYYGAQTGRWGGCMAQNAQNLPRVGKDPKPSDALRNCLRAPAGHKIVVADLSGIELRVNHFLWKVPSSMALFQADPEKADLYKEFASVMYNVPKDEVTKAQRQVGKLAHLGLQYGAGSATFKKVAKTMGGVVLTDDEAQEVVTKWRKEYAPIVRGWREAGNALDHIMRGTKYTIDPWGFCTVVEGGIKTPRGMIRYPNLRYEKDEETGEVSTVYGMGRNKTYIYSSKCVENVIQHLSRCVLSDNMLKISKRYSIAHTVHDELILVVPEAEAEEALDFMQGVMRTPPDWWPELVVWSEGNFGDTYGEAK
jgi:DNA polymerase